MSLKLTVPTLQMPGLSLTLLRSLVGMVQVSFEVPPERNMPPGGALASCVHFPGATTVSRVLLLINGFQENCLGHSFFSCHSKVRGYSVLGRRGSEWLSGSKKSRDPGQGQARGRPGAP